MVAIRHCGQELTGGPTRFSPSRYKVFDPHYFNFPALDCESPTLSLKVDGRLETPTIRTIHFGEEASIQQAFRWRRFFAVDMVMISTGVAAVTALLAFAALPLANRRRLFLTFGAMMGIWALRNVFYIGPLSEKTEKFADLWFYAFTYGLLIASTVFVNEWTLQSQWLRRRVLLPLTIGFGSCVFAIAIGSDAIAAFATRMGYAIAAVSILIMIFLHILALHRVRSLPYFESFIFLVGSSAGLVDLMGQTLPEVSSFLFGWQGLTIPYSSLMPMLTAFAIALFLARENWRVQGELSSANKGLETQLAEREAEIRTAYHEREEKNREASMLRERQRIMEDIHDGFGNRLLALLLQVKRGNFNQKHLSRGLEDSLRDLRLIVDSMDTADGDLGLAFGALRGRLEPDLQGANIEVVWKADLEGEVHDIGPRAVLSIYRMIQEATTNVIRHSDASRLNVNIFWKDGKLVLIVEDNGTGLPTEISNGHGLKNIRNRASALNGDVVFDSDAGLKITITIPAFPSAKA
ncbi:ATP-binding protein [Parasphingorhabdus sp.]|uniref:sensor histidine kinase n=1 Tax=Parasphingorhabdus sp. TaxID=2709688 RepID=UPI003264937A